MEEKWKEDFSATKTLELPTPTIARGMPREKASKGVLILTHAALREHSPIMARKLRVEYPGAIYHLMSRGDRRELIFLDDQDRERFVETLGEACAKTGYRGGDPKKVALAARLRAKTTLTTGWIAQRLHIGTRGYLDHLLHLRRITNA
jgi:hypothetical protein